MRKVIVVIGKGGAGGGKMAEGPVKTSTAIGVRNGISNLTNKLKEAKPTGLG